jgi:signal transduction histidine kinase
VGLIRNPVVQFLAAGVLAVLVVVLGTSELSQRAATEEAIEDSRAITEVLARSVVEPAIPRGLVNGDPDAVAQFDRAARNRLMVANVQRVKIWDITGRVVYSDEPDLIGDQFPLADAERKVLAGEGSAAEVSDLSRDENRFEAGSGGLVEVYTGIVTPEGERLLFEVYYSADRVDARKQEILSSFRPVTLGGLLLLLALATPLIWVLTRRLQASAKARERLFRAAADASDAERRRIARDLHDGVVQDLAGLSFAMAATSQRAREDTLLTTDLGRMGRSLRSSLRHLRSLMVEIYPPNLHTDGLASALDDLVAPAAAADVTASVHVQGLDGVPDDVIAVIWRVAQESVRNSLRHSACSTLSVRVVAHTDVVTLEVVDDGQGFEPDQIRDVQHFGLRGLQDLIAEVGGSLRVRSSPGDGTTVRLEVPLT